MIDLLKKVLKFLPSVIKIIQTLVEVIEDVADDGKRNHSTGKAGSVDAK